MSHLDEAQGQVASIMAKVAATPVEDFASGTRSQPSRDPAAALRWYVISDIFALFVSFIVSWVAAALTHIFVLERGYFMLDPIVEVISALQFLAIGAGVLIVFWYKGHYRRRMPLWLEIRSVTSGLFLAMLFNGFFQLTLKQDFSRVWLMMGWAFAVLFILLFRGFVRSAMRRRGLWHIRTLLVGGDAMAAEARAALRSESGLGYEIVAQTDNLPFLLAQTDNSWERLCGRVHADYIVIALEGSALSRADTAIAGLVRSGLPFSVMPPLRHLPVLGMSAHYFFNSDLIMMSPVNNLEQPLARFTKRALDIVGSGLALLLLSPVFLVLAALVRRDGGPAFYRHERIGLNGKTFNCLKFRSMVLDADQALAGLLSTSPQARAEWTSTQKLRDDPRVTKIGAIMRRLSLDEMPQLINVLRGEMSLVGPRPVIKDETLRYQDEIAFYYRVRPGLTGLWQVSGRSDVSFERRVQMDSWYVRNWSLWHDIAILCKTIPVILNRTGAY